MSIQLKAITWQNEPKFPNDFRAPVIDRSRGAMPPSVLSRHEGADRLGDFIDENGGAPAAAATKAAEEETGFC
jgi:hypothetical protein